MPSLAILFLAIMRRILFSLESERVLAITSRHLHPWHWSCVPGAKLPLLIELRRSRLQNVCDHALILLGTFASTDAK